MKQPNIFCFSSRHKEALLWQSRHFWLTRCLALCEACHVFKYVYTHYSRETSLNQICDKLESKSAKAQIKIETSLNQNWDRLKTKSAKAWIEIETGSNQNRDKLGIFSRKAQKKIIEPSPISFWAFADLFLSLWRFFSEPSRILF